MDCELKTQVTRWNSTFMNSSHALQVQSLGIKFKLKMTSERKLRFKIKMMGSKLETYVYLKVINFYQYN